MSQICDAHSVELIQDRHFNRGFTLWAPEPGKKIVTGELLPPAATEPAIWGMAQWASKFPLTCFTPKITGHNDLVWSNAGKQVIMGGAGSKLADLTLTVDSIAEYGGVGRKANEPWTHLLVEQEFKNLTPVSKIKSLNYRIKVRITQCEADPRVEIEPRHHAAQLLWYLSVQNRNSQSPGFGDYVWFGVPLFDNRERMPGRYINHDDFTARLIYTLPASLLTEQSTHDSEWVEFKCDLLPELLAALEAAWARGYLQGSKDLSDYAPAGMNLGWEVPGPYHVSAQIRSLSLQAGIK